MDTHSYRLSPLGPALQLGGGSSVISASSFWIRLADVPRAFEIRGLGFDSFTGCCSPREDCVVVGGGGAAPESVLVAAAAAGGRPLGLLLLAGEEPVAVAAGGEGAAVLLDPPAAALEDILWVPRSHALVQQE